MKTTGRFLHLVLCVTAALIAASLPSVIAESVEESFVKLSGELPFVSYGDFLFDRNPRDYSEKRVITKAWDALQAVLKDRSQFHKLAALAEHANPKVRMLALLALYATEDPDAFPIIHSHSNDEAAVFPAHSEEIGRAVGEAFKLRTTPTTAGEQARSMLRMIGYPPVPQRNAGQRESFEQWSAKRLNNPDWIGWYDFLAKRASGGIIGLGPHEAREERSAALRKKMSALPIAVRGWLWFGLAEDAMSIPRKDTALATEAEIIAAGKEIGPDALLAFLRDGSRPGLREPKVDHPERGRRFILVHGKELFREQDAEELLKMGHCITAADAKPAMASKWLHEAISTEYSTKYRGWDRAKACAALLDLCGDSERDFIVNWFYGSPNDENQSSDQSIFIRGVQNRMPKQWQATLRALVAHPGFDQLSPLDTMYMALMVNTLAGQKVVATDRDADIRNSLREYFGIQPIRRQQLVSPDHLAERPIWSTRFDDRGTSISVSPDGLLVAVGRDKGNVLIFDAASGRFDGEIPVEEGSQSVQFRKSDGRLLTVSKGELTVWNAVEAKPVTQKKLNAGVSEFAISMNGEILASRCADRASSSGVAVVDLATGTFRWFHEMRIRAFGLFALSPDGSKFAMCDGFTKAIVLWDTATGGQTATLQGHASIPDHAAFSPDGNTLLSTSTEDHRVLLWDTTTGKLRREFENATARWSSIAFTADSKRFIACPQRQQMAVFDCETGVAEAGFAVPGNWVSGVTATPEGERLFVLVCAATGGFPDAKWHTRLECWKLDPKH